MSMPSFDMFKSGPSTEVLRIELEPPGADARTSQGQTCRTPCELTVPTDNELAVTVQMTGYQPQTMPVHVDGKGGDSRLQPNPVYVELQPATPVKPVKPAPTAKRKTSAASPPPPGLNRPRPPRRLRATAPIRPRARAILGRRRCNSPKSTASERGNLPGRDPGRPG